MKKLLTVGAVGLCAALMFGVFTGWKWGHMQREAGWTWDESSLSDWAADTGA